MYKKVSSGITTTLVIAAILTVSWSALQRSHAQTNGNLADTILQIHNKERAAVGVAPLTWSASLAAGAQTWAQHLATTGQFAHDPVHTGLSCTGPCYGENIAGFFNGVSEPNGGQSKWVAEKSLYHGGPSFYAVGHYTQMVWQKTKQVGCGTAPPNGQPSPRGHAFSILVCRYDPPGNYPNELPYPAAAPPSQAVAEEENANTESGALPIEQGAAPPGGSGGGGGENNTGGGGG